MKTKNIFTLLLCLGFSIVSLAETNYTIDIRARTRPSSLNPVASAAYDGMLWGQASKEKPLYGYYRVGAKVGGSPTYAAFLQVAPIAPLIFEVQRGNTHRFLNINTIDCNLADCKGKVERTDYTVRLLAAYQNIVFAGNATWRELRSQDGSKPVGLELEYFTASPGFHRYFETAATLGYKLPEDRLVGITAINGHLSEGDKKMSSIYGIYRFLYQDFTWTVGAGQYRSDEPDQNGISGILLFTKTWGEKLSLY